MYTIAIRIFSEFIMANTISLSPHPDTAHTHSFNAHNFNFLNLTTHDNIIAKLPTKKNDEKIAVTPSQLDRFLMTDEFMVKLFIGRFGLQTPGDVLTFLHSPAGEVAKSMALEKLAEIVAMADNRREQLAEEQTKHYRHFAFLLLGLLHKHSDKTKELNETTQQQFEQRQHKLAQKPIQNTSVYEELSQQLNYYESTAKILLLTINQKIAASHAIADEIALIHQQSHAINQQYDKFNLMLTTFFNDHMLSVLTKEVIEHRIATINDSLEKQLIQINDLIETNNNEQVKILMHEHRGLYLQINNLRDMLAVLENEKHLSDTEGNATTSFHDAAFILTPQQRVVKDSGIYYLIGINQTFASLDDKQKAEAQLKFERMRPEISSVKHSVQHNANLEKARNEQRLASATKRQDYLPKEITFLTKQLEQVKSTKSTLEMALKQHNPNPQFIQNLSNTTPTLSNISAMGLSIQQTLQRMQKSTQQMDIDRLKQFFIAANRYSTKVQNEMAKIVVGKPLQSKTFEFLLKYATPGAISKEAVTPNLKASMAPNLDSKGLDRHPHNTAPSPFKIKPY